MKIQVKFFALLRDRAGIPETTIDLPPQSTIAAAAEAIAAQFPSIKDVLPRIAYAVNREYAALTTNLKDNDELALIPPVSGGKR